MTAREGIALHRSMEKLKVRRDEVEKRLLRSSEEWKACATAFFEFAVSEPDISDPTTRAALDVQLAKARVVAREWRAATIEAIAFDDELANHERSIRAAMTPATPGYEHDLN